MEDNISSRYLTLLTTKVMMVLDRKIHLQTTALLAKNTWNELSWLEFEKKGELLGNWENSLQSFNTFFGIFEKGELKTYSPYLEVIMQNKERSDYKGVTLKQLAHPDYLPSEGSFAVFTLTESDCDKLSKFELCDVGTTSFLLYFLALDSQYVVCFGSVLSEIKKNEQQYEQSIIDNIQEKFDSLSLYPSSIITLFSAKRKILAHKGNFDKSYLQNIPQEILEKVKEDKFLHLTYKNENSVFKGWGETIIRLTYFKAFDWYILTAVPVSEIENHSDEMLYRLTVWVSIVIIGCALSSLFLAYRIINPLQILIKKVLGLAQADFGNFSIKDSNSTAQKMLTDISHNLPIKRTDEVGQLALAFSNMGQALEVNIRNLLNSQAVTERIQGELNAARDIQIGILKENILLPKEKSFQISAFIETAKEVGGDLYDYFTLPNGKKVIVIGDVSGKGMPAALFMSMTVTLIRFAMQDGVKPFEAMQKINDTLAQNNPICMFVTLFIGVFDEKTGYFEYANGGHCYPYIINQHDLTIRELDFISGPMVGALEGIEYTGAETYLSSGDICFLYTDGVTEAMDESKNLYGETRVKNCILHNKNKDTEQLLQEIYKDILMFRGNAEPSDDITMLSFYYTKE